jgi:hypothetical protein
MPFVHRVTQQGIASRATRRIAPPNIESVNLRGKFEFPVKPG